jgi:hypothetical protein
VARPVFKTGRFSQPAKISNKTLGCSPSRGPLNWPIQANSGYKNVYSAPAFALTVAIRDKRCRSQRKAHPNGFFLCQVLSCSVRARRFLLACPDGTSFVPENLVDPTDFALA